jgi:plasmid stabilization system protein ParE
VNLDVVLTRAAKADIAEATTWYRERSATAAERFLAEIASTMRRLAMQPTAQPTVDTVTHTRRVLVRRFPYRVFYVIEDSRAVVLAVIHFRRDDSVWRERS